ncbi:MAG: hypothetical protein ACE5MK_12085 [Acidobacteriota bacterium]
MPQSHGRKPVVRGLPLQQPLEVLESVLSSGCTGNARMFFDNGAKGLSLLDESLAISRELGMRPLMEQVLSRGEILKA